MARKPKAEAPKAAPAAAANNRPPKRKAALAAKKPEIIIDDIDKPRETAKRSRKVTGKKSHPTYERMIMKAIRTLNKGEATSAIAISNYIFANYPVPEEKYKRFIKVGISKGLKNKNIVKVRGSYRLSAKARDIRKKKKTAEKEEGAEKPKRERSASPKKKASPKRAASPKKADAGKRKKEEEAEKPKSRARKAKEANNDNNKEAAKPAPKKKRESKKAAEEAEQPQGAKVKGSKYDHFWQFKQDNGVWGNYDVNASDVIEDVYQKYLANRGDNDVRAVKSGQWEYQVDFMAMKQTNIQHPNHTVRDIRRVPVAN
eukprot:CAMPEP_0168555020 /NCGR_PEP_ID=MMETSP0413-20121227/8101_1 /TAXON_ID=136452 /ORGANISM="Filamoeba nolandi, Strain NC-AS-23-1" /LENGTH=314 /DNA_ID=CAMNT_0008585821 /DNA_START=80 /DNA_END=1024 /DNA_ORIENTATION=+